MEQSWDSDVIFIWDKPSTACPVPEVDPTTNLSVLSVHHYTKSNTSAHTPGARIHPVTQRLLRPILDRTQLPGFPMGDQNPSTAPRTAPSQPPAPRPAPGPSPGMGGNPPLICMENTIPIADIQTEMEGRTFQLRSLLVDAFIPLLNSKGVICLSYQCCLSCFNDCARRGSHWPLTYK